MARQGEEGRALEMSALLFQGFKRSAGRRGWSRVPGNRSSPSPLSLDFLSVDH